MIHLAIHGLYRRRGRALAAMAGIALAVSMAYVIAGVVAGFTHEVDHTLDALGTDFLIPAGTSGALTGAQVAQNVGPAGTQPLLFGRDVSPNGQFDMNIFGFDKPNITPIEGRLLQNPKEIVVDESAGVKLGETVSLRDVPLTVVGITRGLRLYAGAPVAWVSMADMQQLYFGNQKVAQAFVGSNQATPGLTYMSRAQAHNDMSRAVQGAISSLALTRTLLWLMVVGIVLATGRLAILDRRKELAALRCLGATGRSLAVTLAAEGAVVCLLGAVLGVNLGMAYGPLFPLEVERSAIAAGLIIALSVGVALFAGLVGAAQVRRLAPEEAFRSAR